MTSAPLFFNTSSGFSLIDSTATYHQHFAIRDPLFSLPAGDYTANHSLKTTDALWPVCFDNFARINGC